MPRLSAGKLVDCTLKKPYSPNQGQESIFTLRECAQSNPHLEKLLENLFSSETWFIFVSVYISPFPESGPGKHFHAVGMRAIDSPHKIIPIGIISGKNFLNFHTAQQIEKKSFLRQTRKKI